MDAQKLQIIIEMLKQGGGTQEAIAELQTLQAETGKTAQAQKEHKEGVSGLTGEISGLIGRYLAWGFAVHETLKVMRESIAAYKEHDLAVRALNGTLHAGGQFSAEYSEHLQELAHSLHEATRQFSGEQVLNVERVLISFGARREEISDLTKRVLDMAAAGFDLSTSATAVGAAINGDFSPAQRLLKLHLDDTLSRSEKLETVLETLQSRFGGLALATAHGHTALHDFKIQLGEVLVTGLQPYIQALGVLGQMTLQVFKVPKADEAALEETNAGLQAALEKRIAEMRELGTLEEKEADRFLEFIQTAGSASEVFARLSQSFHLINEGKTLPEESNRNYDPERAKRELEYLQKRLELEQANRRAELTERTTAASPDQFLRADRDETLRQINSLFAGGVMTSGQAEKAARDVVQTYKLGLAEIAAKGKEVEIELTQSTLTQNGQRIEKIKEHFNERRNLLGAYYAFEIEKAADNEEEIERIRKKQAKAERLLQEEEKKALNLFYQGMKQVATTAQESFASGFSQAFVDFISGTKSAEQAFREFAASFLRQIAQMILQQMILLALRSVFSGGGQSTSYAADGIQKAAGGVEGVQEVSSATFFPRFSTIAGEAGREVLTVMARPQLMDFNGVKAQVGNVGASRLALVSAAELEAMAGGARRMAGGGTSGGEMSFGGGPGGRSEVLIRLEPGLRADIISKAVDGSLVRVTQEMSRQGPLSDATKRLTA